MATHTGHTARVTVIRGDERLEVTAGLKDFLLGGNRVWLEGWPTGVLTAALPEPPAPVLPPEERLLAAIRARLAAATPGPWEADREPSRTDGRLLVMGGGPAAGAVCRVGPAASDETYLAGVEARRLADAAFIAHAPADVAALLAAVGERDGVISDLIADKDGRVFAEAERGRVVALLREHDLGPGGWNDAAPGPYGDGGRMAIRNALRAVEALGPSRPPLPPARLLAENERLREALAGMLAEGVGPRLEKIARDALGEKTPGG